VTRLFVVVLATCLAACGGTSQEELDVRQALARIPTLQKRVQQTPTDGAGLLALGNERWTAGLYDAAQEAFQKAVDLNPQDAGARTGLAALLCDRGRYMAAADHARLASSGGSIEDADREWLRSYLDKVARLTPPATAKRDSIAGERPGALRFVAIPRTAFRRGDAGGDRDERPVREVEVSAFEIGVTEVTVAQFRQFLAETGYEVPGWFGNQLPPERDEYPICGVSWDDAEAFAIWASIREGGVYRLPTEAEWELAARGPRGYLEPWGNERGTPGIDGNWRRITGADMRRRPSPVEPVGTFRRDRSAFGVYDMAGNVKEWCLDNYDASYYSWSPSRNPYGPTRWSGLKVLRGGAWNHPGPGRFAVFRYRASTRLRYTGYGFRLVREVKPAA
jgi:formylglycine-generating enzyme required for sulfatase activity